MEINILSENQTGKISVKMIEPSFAKQVYLSMKLALPEWLRTPGNPEHTQDVANIMFAASINNEYVGMIHIQLPKTRNAHIDLLIANQPLHLQTIAYKLLSTAENYCYERRYTSLTVELLHSKKNDNNILTDYHFFENSGYKMLFETHTRDPHHAMVYMIKTLSLDDFTFIDLTHSLSPEVPHWGIDAGFKYNARDIKTKELPNDVKIRVQRLEMSAGIGTHMDAPSHCYEHAASISDIPLQALITSCRVIDISHQAHDRYSLTIDDIQRFEDQHGIIPKNTFVIIYTGWDQRWTQPEKYRNEKIFPYISIDAAKILLSRDIAGIGIDTLSPDAFGSDFPVHQLILGSGKYIIENVANAKQLDPTGCFIFALPMKITEGTEAPIRLVGMKRKKANI